MLEDIKKNTRAALRATAGIALILPVVAATALQGFVVGPLTGNYTVIPNAIYKTMGKLFGMKFEFNAASKPLEKDKQTWFVANHMSIADFIVLGSTLPGTFAGKGDLLKWPGIAQMARAVKYIGLRRSKEFNPQSRAKIIKNFNAGHNTIMFPEGTTTPGKTVALFHAGLITALFGEKGVDKEGKEVALEKDVVVQPVAIRVKEVAGQNAIGNDDLRNLYSMYDDDNTLRRIWRRMQIKSMTIELTAFEPLKPTDFKDAKDLINNAALSIASVVNPGQTTFEKAKIPGQNLNPKTVTMTTPAPAPAPTATPEAEVAATAAANAATVAKPAVQKGPQL
ncbi:MAG: 1-acyl-sn-glycerol-3-phosphate acyltransferase [Alphaproteobacteria bacterium]